MSEMNKGLIIILAWSLLSIQYANASRSESGNNKVVYFDKSGKKISPIEADRLASQDEAVLGCEPMEKVCNERTGKCPLKKVK